MSDEQTHDMRRLRSMPRSSKTAKKTHELIAERLRQRILAAELQPGDRLPPEDELTQEFGIARTTLREALRVLESQGLLRIQRGRGGGPVVTHPSLAPAAIALAIALQLRGTTIGDLDEARRFIEPQLAGHLALHHSAADVKALLESIEVAHDAAERNDAIAFGPASAAVHETLVERAGNTTLATVSQLIHEMVQAYYASASAGSTQKLMRRAVRSYRRLVEYVEAGDQEGAVAHWQAQMSFTIGHRDQDAPVSITGIG